MGHAQLRGFEAEATPAGPFGMDHFDFLGWLHEGGGDELGADLFAAERKVYPRDIRGRHDTLRRIVKEEAPLLSTAAPWTEGVRDGVIAARGEEAALRRTHPEEELVDLRAVSESMDRLACALAQTMPQLVGARVLQGFGAAGVMSVNTALIQKRRCMSATGGLSSARRCGKITPPPR